MAFQKGDMVKVINKNLETYGRIGTVASNFTGGQTLQVSLGAVVLTYKKSNLQKVTSESEIENNISNKGECDMLIGNYKIVKIKFIEGANTNTEYHYAFYDPGYDVGINCDDYVVVKSAHHGFGLARVTGIIPDEDVTQTMRDYCNEGREIVSKFDMASYEARVEKRKAARQLKADMNKKMKEMQEIAMFEIMAKESPELKEMLDAYKELIK